MNARVIMGLVLAIGGALACLGAPSDRMNYFLIPGAIIAVAGAILMIWGSTLPRIKQ